MKKRIALLLTLVLALSLTACGSGEDQEQSGDGSGGQDQKETVDRTWIQRHLDLLASGEGADHQDYDALRMELDAMREESGATYMYLLLPMKDGVPALDGDPNGDFAITVDGGEDPDDYGLSYGWEIQFLEAWEGTPAAARSAWDEEDFSCWSGFAPVYHDGAVVGLLGVDYPCTDLMAEYPEWNRDREGWNGFEDEITGEIPAAVQAQMDQSVSVAEKYAKQVSGQ